MCTSEDLSLCLHTKFSFPGMNTTVFIDPSDPIEWQLGKPRQGDVIPMWSCNSLETEVNSRESAYGRDRRCWDICCCFCAVVVCEYLQVRGSRAMHTLAGWAKRCGSPAELLEQLCIRLCWFKRALKWIFINGTWKKESKLLVWSWDVRDIMIIYALLCLALAVHCVAIPECHKRLLTEVLSQ